MDYAMHMGVDFGYGIALADAGLYWYPALKSSGGEFGQLERGSLYSVSKYWFVGKLGWTTWCWITIVFPWT